MKTKLSVLLGVLLWSLSVSAQWSQKAAFPGISKAKSAAFTIGNKIYVMGGVDNSGNILHDFWEYDITTDTWLQKPNFPGPERYGAASFVINNKGYIATGGNDFGYLDDLWEFNPLTGNWSQRAGLPAFSAQHENQRTEAFSFVIGNKGYLGGGTGFVFGPNSTNNIAFYDLWEYNPATNSWLQKADISDFTGRNMSIAASINNKGYVGLGCDVNQTINHQTFLEYDQATDSWTTKASFPSAYTTDAGAFVIDSFLYVLGGVNLSPVGLSNQFYKYDPATDSWSQLAAFNGGAIAGQFVVSTGNTAFSGTGYNGNIITRSDLWELSFSTAGIDGNDLTDDPVAQVYPNPAGNFVSISSKKDISFVDIYDVTGTMVRREENTIKNIGLFNLNAGVYIVKMTCRDGCIIYRRFIKSN